MRIRKNAKLVVEGCSRGAKTSFLICQLNRAPWDAQDECEWDNYLPLNGSFNGSVPPSDSLRSGESQELSFEYVEKTTPSQSELEKPVNASGGEDEELIGGGGYIRSCITRQAKRSPSMCDQLPKSFSAPFPPKKVTVPKKRGRPRNSTKSAGDTMAATAGADNNAHEFYYYSGFGPRWSKRRSGYRCTSSNRDNYDEHNVNEDYGNGALYVSDNVGTSSNGYESMSEDNDNYDEDENKKYNVSDKKVGIESVVGEELDYIYDEEEEEMFGGRARKPIKARSLKSLM